MPVCTAGSAQAGHPRAWMPLPCRAAARRGTPALLGPPELSSCKCGLGGPRGRQVDRVLVSQATVMTTRLAAARTGFRRATHMLLVKFDPVTLTRLAPSMLRPATGPPVALLPAGGCGWMCGGVWGRRRAHVHAHLQACVDGVHSGNHTACLLACGGASGPLSLRQQHAP